jgi:hypothetical protein
MLNLARLLSGGGQPPPRELVEGRGEQDGAGPVR